MQNVPLFRRKLAHRLRHCAARQLRACAGDPSGDDLKIIALFDRLARDAEQLPQGLVDEVAQRCADPAFARRFDQTWDIVAEAVGVLLVPETAADLVRWMVDQARHEPGAAEFDPPPGPPAPMMDPSTIAERSATRWFGVASVLS